MSIMNAISGLLASNNYIDIISNNIANASTTGFKSSKPSFCEMISKSLMARDSAGSGAITSGLIQNFNHGVLVNTGRELDIGINQDGFFRVVDNNGEVHYTRNGQFSIDKEKNIINMQGLYLTGIDNNIIKNNTNDINTLEPINLKKKSVLLGQPTKNINFSPILNSDDNPSLSEQKIFIPYNTSVTIYDKNITPQKLDVTFDKDNTNKNIWKVHIISRNLHDNSINKNINNTFTIEFNNAGQLISPSTFHISKTNKNNLDESIILNLTGITAQKKSKKSFSSISQDGYPEGTLQSFDILKTGKIMGIYSNQKINEISQIILAKFMNPIKLKPESANLWSATLESGDPQIGTAGNMGFGTLISKSLESSNVDLNKELLDMIIAQRNYQSNAQALKTEDKILSMLVNLR